MKIKIKSAAQIKSFPAEASPTGGRDVFFSGTGFSREEAGVFTINFAACPLTHSRLKPVPLNARGVLSDRSHAPRGNAAPGRSASRRRRAFKPISS